MGGMRTALGIALALGVSIVGLLSLFEWLVRIGEPKQHQHQSFRTHWLLWQSGIVRRGK